MTVMYYEARDVYRWATVTGTVLFALIALCLALAMTGVVDVSPVESTPATDSAGPLGPLSEYAVGGGSAILSLIAVAVFAPLAWVLGRALQSVTSPAAHGWAFAGLGALLGALPMVILSIVGGGGLSILLTPVAWGIILVIAGASAIGWTFAYRRQHDELDWRWWEILFDNWFFSFRR